MYNEGEQQGAPEGMETITPSTPPHNDEHTKHVIYLSIAFVALLVVAGIFGYSAYNTEEVVQPLVEPVPEEIVYKEVKDACVYASDGEAHMTAINETNLQACLCINDEGKRDLCRTVVGDSMFLKSALAQMDVTLCEGMSDEQRKENCLQLVKSSLEHFESADPQHLANLQMHANNEEAIGRYESLLQDDPNNLPNLLSLAFAYTEKGLKEQEKGGDQTPFIEKAIEVIERAKKIDSTSSEIYRVEGYIYEVKPDLVKAMELYEKAISINPENFQAYAGKGHVERMLGLLEQSIESFYKAAELDASNASEVIYANLCSLEHSRGELNQAKANCLIVSENKEGNGLFKSSALQTLSLIAIAENDLHLAESYLVSASTISPNDPNLHVSWSRLKIYMGEYSESEKHARKAIELTSTKASAYLALSYALYMQNSFQESISVAEQGLGLVTNDVSLLEPSKRAVQRDFYYSIANNYREMGEIGKQQEYVKLAEALQ